MILQISVYQGLPYAWVFPDTTRNWVAKWHPGGFLLNWQNVLDVWQVGRYFFILKKCFKNPKENNFDKKKKLNNFWQS